jgi:DNA mismatch repair protein MutS
MALTPMMIQYFQVKEKCKDCILFFRLGDFYEMFFEDAETASRELELVLTGRDCGLENRAPMCGIPFHAANNYISRLINKGYKVAICEQMEDPALAKGIVKRDIIKIITPGTYTDPSFIEDTKNNFIMSICNNEEKHETGISFADISTGEFYCTEFKYNIDLIISEVSKFNPSEIILQKNISKEVVNSLKERFSVSFTEKEEDFFNQGDFKNLTKTLNITSLNACRGILNYIVETQKISLSNINEIEFYDVVDYLTIDVNTRRNLELIETLRDKLKKGSLLWVLDKTNTAMGARTLRKWIEQPLINKKYIDMRLSAVEEIMSDVQKHSDLKEELKGIYDIERIIGKISSLSVNAKELLSLKSSVGKIPGLKQLLAGCKSKMLSNMHLNLDELQDIYELIHNSINENPSFSVKEGNIIKDGFNSEVDELREAKAHGKEWIAALESTEREFTGIKSLKVGYNRVFGYYIEITKSNFSSIPEGRYIRKQTLSNAERFITPELKEMEDKILGAEEKLVNLEYEIFVNIRNSIEQQINRMKKCARIISELDCLSAFSSVSLENNYCKPEITLNGEISIHEGRHPVVEKMLPAGSFISNDSHLDKTDNQMLLITGPNMAGKSTFMRQVALIVIMAQVGCFVPAKKAVISICDKVFTRIGASDDLSAGKSTFMVEMWEVSNILRNATNRSLLLLDEVGRGTSTYDGLSIAWAIIEYLCNNSRLRSKTLFATHYHELTKLEGTIYGVKNYSVAVKRINNEIIFLRKIISGGADESYGIEVAALAGLPKETIIRAKEILMTLENDKHNTQIKESTKVRENTVKQLDFLDIEKEEIINAIKALDINNMTPLECLNSLNKLVHRAKAL